MNTLSEGTILQGKVYRYRLEKILGQGTFGITYQASTPMKMQGPLGTKEMQVKVAVKEFFMRDINGRDGTSVTSGSKGGMFDYYKKNFLREARNLSKMTHPNIVKVVELFETNNTAYFVMELLTGGSLDDRIKGSGPMQESEAIAILCDIGSAVSFMHSSKMLHLDIKPQNVMLRDDGSAVVIDFGLSKQYGSDGRPETSTNVGMGTPGYAPLEQSAYRDGRGFPVTMDVYALGGTLYKMLTGNTPPVASDVLNESQLIPDELQEKHISDAVASCIIKSMSPMVANRYPTVDAFMSALANAAPSPSSHPVPADDGTDYDDILEVTVTELHEDDVEEAEGKETNAQIKGEDIVISPDTAKVKISFMPEHWREEEPIGQYICSVTPKAVISSSSGNRSMPLQSGEYQKILKELSRTLNQHAHKVPVYGGPKLDDATRDFFPAELQLLFLIRIRTLFRIFG